MPVIWSDVELNTQADAVATRCVEVGLHDGDPGATGLDNEASGGSPAYARVPHNAEPAGDEGSLGASQPATVGLAWAAPVWDVPAGVWTWVSFWAAGDVFMGRVQLPEPVTTVAQDEVHASFPFNATL